MSSFKILAIETSCDETSVAILDSSSTGLSLLSNVVSSQVKLHAKWGGVVPNLAAREHVKNFPRILEEALSKAGQKLSDIDLLSVVNGPGLIPALLVGTNFAKTLAFQLEKPLIGIHHIEGHIYANFISDKVSVNPKFKFLISNENTNTKKHTPTELKKSKTQDIQNKNSCVIRNYELEISNLPNIKFPILCLVVSGGHTQLVLMKDHLQYEIIGQTLDDAAGEAFDKVARILDLGYPGGPEVSARAANFQFPIFNFQSNNNDQISKQNPRNTKIHSCQLPVASYGIKFPRPMMNSKDFNFSFSGLKTAVLYETKKHPDLLKNEGYIAEVCHEFQQASIDVLISKTLKAAEKYSAKTIMLAGGVSANKELREQLGQAIASKLPVVSYQVPDLSLTGDNAAMIAAAAAFRWEKMSDVQKKEALNGWKTIQPDANLKLK